MAGIIFSFLGAEVLYWWMCRARCQTLFVVVVVALKVKYGCVLSIIIICVFALHSYFLFGQWWPYCEQLHVWQWADAVWVFFFFNMWKKSFEKPLAGVQSSWILFVPPSLWLCWSYISILCSIISLMVLYIRGGTFWVFTTFTCQLLALNYHPSPPHNLIVCKQSCTQDIAIQWWQNGLALT